MTRDRPGRTERVLVLGATSAIAQAACRIWAARGAALCLVGRDAYRLAVVRDDLLVRGARAVSCQVLDFEAYDAYEPLLETGITDLGGLDVALLAHGQLPDQGRAQREIGYLVETLRTNAISPIVAATIVANRLEEQGGGTLVIVGSVAGDRGRRSNYAYGTAKAALETFAEGVRQRLAASGAHVLLVKPGLVDTPMTAHLAKNALFSSPARVGREVVRAVDRGTEELYTPFYWRLILLAIRLLPRPVFKRLSL